ncbi:TIGR03617 family F420-dependent LLM class oxidoreductase [Mycobacterium sp.]|jgi:probable F420-dependent oxidoreductase|uniref:TIGR03617 family F420-dependent LLM class oxidoreductase n=1 Tax=Mycobacterium sp. TaxID=1785 RepID=UPI002D5478A5|nr:TIGR03617 family F420-dependent LLM class oxidoreductase [Mycobacterium sp.]HZA08780.1 TIGR03617 family F420-dependent LLM class oxidoreductase [Mycobacterium sp.]
MFLHVQLDASPDRAAERAKTLAAAGVDGLFTFEGQHDVFLPLASAAPVADVELMTNVAIALPRSPLHLAHAAYDLQLLSRGRFRLGLGSQVRAHVENRYGTSWSRPAARMGETVLAVRAIFDAWQHGHRLEFRGEFSKHTLMPPNFSPGPNPYGAPPIYLGALGPVMTRTAAQVADGLLMMPFHSARHFRERTLPAVDAGLARSGRGRTDFDIVPQVIAAMGRTDEELAAASRGARMLLGFYGSTPAYAPVLEIEGRPDLQPQLNVLSKRLAVDEMTGLIDETLLTTLAVRGTPEECAQEILARFADVAERVCVYFPGYQVDVDDIRALAKALHGG